MPKVIRSLIDLSQGHCFSPTPCLTGSPDVFAENIPVVRQFDDYGQIHFCGIIWHPMGVAIEGSPTVFVNGMGVHRDADRINCGDVADNGANTVFADEGGSYTNNGGNTIGYTVNIPIYSLPYNNITVYARQHLGFITYCDKFYQTGFGVNGIPFILPGEIYTPREEEGTGRIVKDFSIPVITTITPDLPSFLTFNSINGSISFNGNPITQTNISYVFTVTCTNHVGSSQFTINLEVKDPPALFGCT
jgi:uncharacterized Zn-binding protein involved in type VI secretion